jgi:hypothetical protein
MAPQCCFSNVLSRGLVPLLASSVCLASDYTVGFKFTPGRLQISIDGKDFAT